MKSEKLKAWLGAVLAFVGLLSNALAAVAGLVDNARKVFGNYPYLWMFGLATMGVVVLVFGILLFLDGVARRSRRVRKFPRLDAKKSRYLVGRDGDIAALKKMCLENPVVYLVGESGAGKSALVWAGLRQDLESNPGKLIPVYLDIWGLDWEKSPREDLYAEFSESSQKNLTQEERDKCDITIPLQAAKLVKVCRTIHDQLGRIPLLIFDQFDDYQTRHRDKFLPRRRKTWLTPEELVEQNAFWRDIRALIDSGIAHCLFVTRSDTSSGLISVSFGPPQSPYMLDRLSDDDVLTILIELTQSEEKVVAFPENGWEDLKKQLASDLDQESGVLPIQMNAAIQGLNNLDYLTVPAYERQGGLKGLESGRIERFIRNAVSVSNYKLTEEQVRSLLVFLVDKKQEPLKTIEQSELDILNHLRPRPSSEGLKEVLNYLGQEKNQVIRKRAVSGKTPFWRLDHDYLCRGVIEADRRANYWMSLIRNGYETFKVADWRRFWTSLLTPWQQIQLAYQWLYSSFVRGKTPFRYRGYRPYALWSLLRFAPYLLILVAILVGLWGYGIQHQDERDRKEAQTLFAQIDWSHPLRNQESWDLADAREEVRHHFVRWALENPVNARNLERQSESVIHAIVGINPDRRLNLWKKVISPRLRDESVDLEIRHCCIVIGKSLSIAQIDETFIDQVVAVMDKTDDIGKLRTLAGVLGSLGEKLPPAQALAAFERLVAVMDKTDDFGKLRTLADGLERLGGKLPPAALPAGTPCPPRT
jgi:hypothetical protein